MEWEVFEESGQQRLEALGGTFLLWGENDIYMLSKMTPDAAGPNCEKPTRFATEKRAKGWVSFLIEEDGK